MSKILKAEYGSDKTKLKLGAVEIPCYVLEDGTRVLSGRGIQRALGATATSGSWLSKFINNSPITPYLKTGVLEQLNDPIIFKRPQAGGSQSSTYGYEATILIDICSAISEANETGDFPDKKIAQAAGMIIRSVAKVGIIALIDEITGYQEIRDKEALQKYLERFLRKEYAIWVKRFPRKFTDTICKLKGWDFNPGSTKYPPAVGHVINDIVYKRLAPGVLNELKKKNPVMDNGRRKTKHHQWLSDEIGVPSLAEHLIGVQSLMSANTTWRKFYDQLNRVFPEHNAQQLYLEFPDNKDV